VSQVLGGRVQVMMCDTALRPALASTWVIDRSRPCPWTVFVQPGDVPL